MKKRILFLFLLAVAVFRTVECSVRYNVIPVMAKTLEISSELRNYPGYSLNFNAGYSLKWDSPIYGL